MSIYHAHNNKYIRIWFSSAINLTIEGDLAFIDVYKTSFYEALNSKSSNLKLSNGTFQNWSFSDCHLQLNATNATLFRWYFEGYNFIGTLVHSDIRESNFQFNNIRYPIDYGRAKVLHSHVKRLYSQIGKKKEASLHFYLEKTFERKSFLRFKANFREEYYTSKKIWKIPFSIYLPCKYYLKYIYSLLLNILWGYGEKPQRLFFISVLSIIFFSLVFCLSPGATVETKGDLLNSLYYSMVTFTTLGYGDIKQTDYLLKLVSGFEALLGMSFWGILIAGFTNNSKDY